MTTYETYYPEQRHLLTNTTIRRERALPDNAVGLIEVEPGDRVDLRDVIGHGSIPSRYHIVDAARFFKLKNPADLQSLLLVGEGTPVEVKQPMAGKSASRGRRLFSPVAGVVARIADGRIIIQEEPETFEVLAGLIGTVVAAPDERSVVIETSGAVLQGVWGNNRLMIGTLREEPDVGLDAWQPDAIEMAYRGAIVVTRRPLTLRALRIAQEQDMAGLVAPSMPVGLIDAARRIQPAVLLTEGFGATRMSSFVYGFLAEHVEKQATVDATYAGHLGARRPELIVNIPARSGQRPPPPVRDIVLQVGMNVRLTRGLHAGSVGQIAHLPKTPYSLENGLRVPCAQVQLSTGEAAFVPLANIEVFGH